MGDECPRTMAITTRLLARFPLCESTERKIPTHIGGTDNLYGSPGWPILLRFVTSLGSLSDQYETVAASPALYLLC